MNMIVAGMAFVIITSYSLAVDARRGYSSDYQRWAVALVIGLIATVTIAWLLQEFIVPFVWDAHDPLEDTDRATWMALLLGLVVAIIVRRWFLKCPSSEQDSSGTDITGNSRIANLEKENAVLRAQQQELADSVEFWMRQVIPKGQ